MKKINSIDRRSFIKNLGALGLGLASTGVFNDAFAKAVTSDKTLCNISEARLAMGTSVSMTLVHSSRKQAEDAIVLAFKEIDRLSALMNHFDNQTPISRLNREGRLKDAHPDIIEVISNALKYYRLTQGAFDISIKPVIDLFKKNFSRGKDNYPSKKEITEALALVGSDKIEIKGGDIRFKKQGMGITLAGIAKGYIVDRASKIILGHGIKNHLINAGGDIKAIGVRLDKKPWTVAIQDPMKKGGHLDVIHLKDAAVATSGNYENYFDREKMVHHIANPKTGFSPVLNSSASVMAPTAMEADALATSLLVMKSADGLSLINSLPQCEALIISISKHIRRSAGWKSAAV